MSLDGRSNTSPTISKRWNNTIRTTATRTVSDMETAVSFHATSWAALSPGDSPISDVQADSIGVSGVEGETAFLDADRFESSSSRPSGIRTALSWSWPTERSEVKSGVGTQSSTRTRGWPQSLCYCELQSLLMVDRDNSSTNREHGLSLSRRSVLALLGMAVVSVPLAVRVARQNRSTGRRRQCSIYR